MMRKFALAALAALGVSGAADAAVLTLQDVTNNGPNDFTFEYQITLGPDEGVRAGDRFVVFDFGGYIDDSAFSTAGNLSASYENVTTGTLVTPGQNDDPTVGNLVFTYTGPDFRISAGPLAPFDFAPVGARSTFGGTALDAFFSLTTKNNPARERGTKIYTVGLVSVPANAIPEPATWAMMIGGFSLAGAAVRRKARLNEVTA